MGNKSTKLIKKRQQQQQQENGYSSADGWRSTKTDSGGNRIHVTPPGQASAYNPDDQQDYDDSSDCSNTISKSQRQKQRRGRSTSSKNELYQQERLLLKNGGGGVVKKQSNANGGGSKDRKKLSKLQLFHHLHQKPDIISHSLLVDGGNGDHRPAAEVKVNSTAAAAVGPVEYLDNLDNDHKPAEAHPQQHQQSQPAALASVYLPARPRRSNRSAELVRRATLAEPEPSFISDSSSVGTVPPTPPIPPAPEPNLPDSDPYPPASDPYPPASDSYPNPNLNPSSDPNSAADPHPEPDPDTDANPDLDLNPNPDFDPSPHPAPTNLDVDPNPASDPDPPTNPDLGPDTYPPNPDQAPDPTSHPAPNQDPNPDANPNPDPPSPRNHQSIRLIGNCSNHLAEKVVKNLDSRPVTEHFGSAGGSHPADVMMMDRHFSSNNEGKDNEPCPSAVITSLSSQRSSTTSGEIAVMAATEETGSRRGSQQLHLLDPMKWAFYNVSAFTMAVCSVFGALAAYFLFYEFVKPAMWALICGIVLFPLKRRLSGLVKGWLDQLSDSGKPLTLAIAALPLDVTNRLGDLLLDTTTNNLKMVLLMIAAFPASALILHFETIPRSLVTAKRCMLLVDNLVSFFHGFWVPQILLAYLSYICVSNLFPRCRSRFLCHVWISWAIWSAGVAYGCNYLGPFRTPVFLALTAICCTYYFPLFNALRTSSTSANNNRLSRKSTMRRSERRHQHHQKPTISSNNKAVVSEERNRSLSGNKEIRIKPVSPDQQQPDEDGQNESNTYLKRLFIACFFVYVSLHLWVMFILILPIGAAVARRIAVKFDLWSIIRRKSQSMKSKFGQDTALLFPAPFVHVFRVLLHIDKQIIYYLRQSMDLVGSMTAMILLLVVVAAVFGFVMFQLYYESMHLINLTADIANQTLTKNPGLQRWLRNTVHVDSVADLANEAVQRAYGISRNWLSAQMQEIVQDDPEKAKLLESQVVNTLDAFFHNWLVSRNASTGNISGGGAITALASHSAGAKTAIGQWADLWTALGEGGEGLDWNFFDNIHEYIGLLLSVADSAWMIVKNNMEILMVGFSQIASTLFASGTAVVDFFLDSIVFLTFLMYLLCESDEEYKPLKLIRDLVPGGRGMASKITEQVEQAVNGVFLATSKMAIFYGMFTWLTHTLFAVNLVFIPSVLAAAFAAIPFFGTYLVALPAVLELWLIRGEPFLAILLFVIHYIPSYVVDDAMYSDIRLTTPLLSGMAIAGGMLWWGLEGAIFGPLVLCGILVLGGVYKTIFFKTMTTTDQRESDGKEDSSSASSSVDPVEETTARRNKKSMPSDGAAKQNGNAIRAT